MGNVERSASNAGIPKNCSGRRAACERVILQPTRLRRSYGAAGTAASTENRLFAG
jgi:hypothetical protein